MVYLGSIQSSKLYLKTILLLLLESEGKGFDGILYDIIIKMISCEKKIKIIMSFF